MQTKRIPSPKVLRKQPRERTSIRHRPQPKYIRRPGRVPTTPTPPRSRAPTRLRRRNQEPRCRGVSECSVKTICRLGGVSVSFVGDDGLSGLMDLHMCVADVVHYTVNGCFEGVAVFADAGVSLGHDEEAGGAGPEVVGDAYCPEAWGAEEAQAEQLAAILRDRREWKYHMVKPAMKSVLIRRNEYQVESRWRRRLKYWHIWPKT